MHQKLWIHHTTTETMLAALWHYEVPLWLICSTWLDASTEKWDATRICWGYRKRLFSRHVTLNRIFPFETASKSETVRETVRRDGWMLDDSLLEAWNASDRNKRSLSHIFFSLDISERMFEQKRSFFYFWLKGLLSSYLLRDHWVKGSKFSRRVFLVRVHVVCGLYGRIHLKRWLTMCEKCRVFID